MEENIEKKVEAVLDLLRPFLRSDGGDVELVGIEDGVVKVHLMGACESCSLAEETLHNILERVLKEKVPGVKGVEVV